MFQNEMSERQLTEINVPKKIKIIRKANLNISNPALLQKYKWESYELRLKKNLIECMVKGTIKNTLLHKKTFKNRYFTCN